MTLEDSSDLRSLLERLLPGLSIQEVARRSGQRLVYFCLSTGERESELPWQGLGSVVLKVSEDLNAHAIAYLQKEIEILNSLNSPCYPRLLYNEVFTEDPDTEQRLACRLFVTLEEYIPSLPLSQCRSRFSDEKSVTDLLLKLVTALRLLWEHKSRLVHRDIKPDNILVRENGDIVIIDLGIVREEGSHGITATGSPFGPCTFQYASPEQARNDKLNITFKSDFFSLGTLAYELVAGNNPFASEPGITWHEILHNVITLNVPSLRDLNLSSDRFSKVIERLMEKQPYRRYRTIDRLYQDLLDLKESFDEH